MSLSGRFWTKVNKTDKCWLLRRDTQLPFDPFYFRTEGALLTGSEKLEVLSASYRDGGPDIRGVNVKTETTE